MAAELISKKTRTEFQEFLVGRTLRQITSLFDAADLMPKESHLCRSSGERRGLVEQYYAGIDFTKWADVRKLLKVYEMVLLELQEPPAPFSYASPDHNRVVAESLSRWLRRDGLDIRDGRIVSLGEVPGIDALVGVAEVLDAVHLREQLDRLAATVETDPRLAIGTAKEVVETTCKTILRERQVVIDGGWNVTRLVKETRMCLDLADDDIPDHAPASETVKRVLSSLANVAQGLAELRNSYGTGHGADGRARGLGPRHARLAVGAATTLCTFLFQTHEERKAAKGPIPNPPH